MQQKSIPPNFDLSSVDVNRDGLAAFKAYVRGEPTLAQLGLAPHQTGKPAIVTPVPPRPGGNPVPRVFSVDAGTLRKCYSNFFRGERGRHAE